MGLLCRASGYAAGHAFNYSAGVLSPAPRPVLIAAGTPCGKLRTQDCSFRLESRPLSSRYDGQRERCNFEACFAFVLGATAWQLV